MEGENESFTKYTYRECGRLPDHGDGLAPTVERTEKFYSTTTNQQQQPQLQPQQGPSLTPNMTPDMEPNPQMEQDQAKMRNVERQKQLVSDTEKLLALANELKLDVDKSNKDTLSLDVIKKADEIEKLAHNVKEKMKGT